MENLSLPGRPYLMVHSQFYDFLRGFLLPNTNESNKKELEAQVVLFCLFRYKIPYETKLVHYVCGPNEEFVINPNANLCMKPNPVYDCIPACSCVDSIDQKL